MKLILRLSMLVLIPVSAYNAQFGFVQAAHVGNHSAVVESMAQEPAHITSSCFVPTRANIAAQRAACDERAESLGYGHGVLRPRNQHDDDQGLPIGKCQMVVVGEPTPQQYVCLGVGGW